MGKFFKIVGMGCGGCLVIILAVGAFGYSQLDDNIHVERSRVIDAPIEVLFPLVDSLQSWSDWDPWSQLDSGITITHEGPPAGTGAIRRWSSNDRSVGTGSIEIVDSLVGERIDLDIDMGEGMAVIHAIFEFEETPNGIRVTWTDTAQLEGFVQRLFGLVANDYYLGPMLDEGLKSLDEVAMKKAATILSEELGTESLND
ncbi:MAG: hypothetical protein ACI8TQ_002901 [Planctomycetota bacterium]